MRVGQRLFSQILQILLHLYSYALSTANQCRHDPFYSLCPSAYVDQLGLWAWDVLGERGGFLSIHSAFMILPKQASLTTFCMVVRQITSRLESMSKWVMR